MTHKLCTRCGENNEVRPGAYWCANCFAESNRLYSQTEAGQQAQARKREKAVKRGRAYILQHLQTHPCVDCGEDDMIVLEFDHVRGIKKKAVAELVAASITTLQAEIDKCEVRCANCHKRRHWRFDDEGRKVPSWKATPVS